jgi:hypothetical protein
MNCREARLAAMDGRETPHVRDCAECAAFLADYRKISGALKLDRAPASLDESLRAIPEPRRPIRMWVALGLSAAAGLLLALPYLIPEPPAPAPSVEASVESELEKIRRETERLELKYQLISLEERVSK